jgi:hypothetical protein
MKFFKLLTLRKPLYLNGVPIWLPLGSAADHEMVRMRLREAMELLRIHAPSRHQRVLKCVRGFMIFGAGSVTADFHQKEGVCRLAENFVFSTEGTLAAIASTIVHEATHGWLFGRGIGYNEPIRHRVERICIRAALFVSLKLPNAGDEVERCRRELVLGPEVFSDAGIVAMQTRSLREHGCPEWLIRLVLQVRRIRGG